MLYRFANGPSAHQALGENRGLFLYLRGFSSGWRPSARRPLVCSLLFPCRPSAVPRLVAAIVVDAVNRMLRTRPLAHICKKVFERLPALTDLYAAAAIVVVIGVPWKVASGAHIVPCYALRRQNTRRLGDTGRFGDPPRAAHSWDTPEDNRHRCSTHHISALILPHYKQYHLSNYSTSVRVVGVVGFGCNFAPSIKSHTVRPLSVK